MTSDDKAAYERAFSAAQTRAEREGRIVAHCIWRDGELTAATSPKASEAPPPVDVPQGQLL
jgi:hypothetical protein